MSKKDKSKFRKHIKAQILQQMAQVQAKEKMAATPVVQSPRPASPIVTTESNTVAIPGLQNLPQIKSDLKKTGLVVGGLILILAVLYLLDLKYNILLSFGNIIFGVFHINQ